MLNYPLIIGISFWLSKFVVETVAMEAEDEDESLMTQLSEAMGGEVDTVAAEGVEGEADEGADAVGEAAEAPIAAPDGEASAPMDGEPSAPAAQPEVEAAVEQEEAVEPEESEAQLKDEDIVPLVSYDEKSNFSKDGRWVLPKRSQFPSVFCPLRVRLRLSSTKDIQDISVANPYKMTVAQVEEILRDSLGFRDLIRFDDCRDRIDAAANAREIIAAINGDLPQGLEVGNVREVETYSLSITVVHVSETCHDSDPDRIHSLASRLRESESCDAIVLELPQIWIISDPEFRAKSASIGLYPGSFWMGFLKSWGAVKVAEVFFTICPGDRREPTVSVAVQFREQEHLKMCFTFLHDRYLVHPKQKNALRQPWIRLVVFEDFKAKTLGRPAQAKARPKAKSLQINRPTIAPKASPPAPKKEAKSFTENFEQLTPAEAMAGLSGRQLEAFQMVMSRMERLERENKELMQVLVQMQALLQQSQQRNEQLAGLQRADPTNTSRLAMEAQRQAMMTPPVPAAPSLDELPDTKRKADVEAPEADMNAPWKHQRRRQRRSGPDATETAEADGDQGGLAAYHNALLGGQ